MATKATARVAVGYCTPSALSGRQAAHVTLLLTFLRQRIALQVAFGRTTAGPASPWWQPTFVALSARGWRAEYLPQTLCSAALLLVALVGQLPSWDVQVGRTMQDCTHNSATIPHASVPSGAAQRFCGCYLYITSTGFLLRRGAAQSCCGVDGMLLSRRCYSPQRSIGVRHVFA